MVGIFSRLSSKNIHRRTQSALDQREVLPQNSEVAAADTAVASTAVAGTAVASTASAPSHGIELAVEFKPVEHPVEPHDNDRPIQCPLPEPSILNDGRIWTERITASIQRKADMPATKEAGAPESEGAASKPRQIRTNRVILPTISAPECDILKLLEESGM